MNPFEKYLLFDLESFPNGKIGKKLETRNFGSAKVSHLIN